MRTSGLFRFAGDECGLSAGAAFEETRHLIEAPLITLAMSNPSHLEFVAYLYHLLAPHSIVTTASSLPLPLHIGHSFL